MDWRVYWRYQDPQHSTGLGGVGCRVPGLWVLTTPTPQTILSSLRPQRRPSLDFPNYLWICLSSRALRDPRDQLGLRERWDPR